MTKCDLAPLLTKGAGIFLPLATSPISPGKHSLAGFFVLPSLPRQYQNLTGYSVCASAVPRIHIPTSGKPLKESLQS